MACVAAGSSPDGHFRSVDCGSPTLLLSLPSASYDLYLSSVLKRSRHANRAAALLASRHGYPVLGICCVAPLDRQGLIPGAVVVAQEATIPAQRRYEFTGPHVAQGVSYRLSPGPADETRAGTGATEGAVPSWVLRVAT